MSASQDQDKSSSTSTATRPLLQASKRRPDSDLNHDNWDQEDEPEEKGEFKKASDDQLKDRKILTAKRKQKAGAPPPNNPFGGLNLAATFKTPNNGTTANKCPASSMFNFSSSVASAQTPKFDFSGVTSSPNSTEKEEVHSWNFEPSGGDSNKKKVASSSVSVKKDSSKNLKPEDPDSVDSDGLKIIDSSNSNSRNEIDRDDSVDPTPEDSSGAAPETDESGAGDDSSATKE